MGVRRLVLFDITVTIAIATSVCIRSAMTMAVAMSMMHFFRGIRVNNVENYVPSLDHQLLDVDHDLHDTHDQPKRLVGGCCEIYH